MLTEVCFVVVVESNPSLLIRVEFNLGLNYNGEGRTSCADKNRSRLRNKKHLKITSKRLSRLSIPSIDSHVPVFVPSSEDIDALSSGLPLLFSMEFWKWATTEYSSSGPRIPGLVVDESWEDAAGRSGGCVWPPRSYSCSFCRREFRSAQALGGHMNVHRRDRARLKQCSSLSGETTDDHRRPDPRSPPLVLHPAANPNPNSGVVPPKPAPPFSSSITRDYLTGSNLSTITSPGDSTAPLHLLVVSESGVLGSWTDPEISDEETNCNKRRRIEPTPEVFFLAAFSGDRRYEVLDENPVQELDLELRLGDAPKIK